MGKYFILAEKLSEKFSPEIMCSILGGASDKDFRIIERV